MGFIGILFITLAISGGYDTTYPSAHLFFLTHRILSIYTAIYIILLTYIVIKLKGFYSTPVLIMLLLYGLFLIYNCSHFFLVPHMIIPTFYSFKNSKEKMHFEAFCRVIAEANINVKKCKFDIVDPKGNLFLEEKEFINNEIHFFRLILLSFLLLEKARNGEINRSSDDIGYILVQSISLAYHNNCSNEVEIANKLNSLSELICDYTNAVEMISEKEIDEKGEYFFLCTHFAKRVIPSIESEIQRNKNFIAFNIANQTYKLVNTYFNDLFKSVKLID